MYCPGCGKNIPFTGDVCPYCHRDKSKAQAYHLLALASALVCGWIGYLMFKGWGAFFGFIAGGLAVFIKMGTTETPEPVYLSRIESKNNRPSTLSSKTSQTDKKHISPDLISFSYTDEKGESTNREVNVDRVLTRHGNTYIEGFCYLREDERTFIGHRIQGKIFVPSNGQKLTLEEYLAWRGIDDNEDSFQDEEYEEPVYYWETIESVPVNATLKICYQDHRGAKSDRVIRIREYDGTSYLIGFCELRGDRRTFRVERIKSCIDTETGEAIDNVPQYLLEKYHQTPEYILKQGLDKLSDILLVLFYVGKADGQLRAAERSILRAVVRKIAKHEAISDEMIDREFNNAVVPSLQTVKLAINRICKSSGHNMATTYKIAKQIVATQKNVHTSETEILDYMEKKMKKEGVEV